MASDGDNRTISFQNAVGINSEYGVFNDSRTTANGGRTNPGVRAIEYAPGESCTLQFGALPKFRSPTLRNKEWNHSLLWTRIHRHEWRSLLWKSL